MKTLSILIPGLLISILSISATVPTQSVAFIESGDYVKVFYKGSEKETITVSIYDHNNKRVFKEKVCSQNGFSKPYNFSGLPDGKYELRVFSGDKLLNRIVHLKQRSEQSAKHSEVIARVTQVVGVEGKYVLSLPKKGADQVELNVFSAERKIVYHKILAISDATAMILNLNSLKGEYLLEVTSNNNIKNSFLLNNQ